MVETFSLLSVCGELWRGLYCLACEWCLTSLSATSFLRAHFHQRGNIKIVSWRMSIVSCRNFSGQSSSVNKKDDFHLHWPGRLTCWTHARTTEGNCNQNGSLFLQTSIVKCDIKLTCKCQGSQVSNTLNASKGRKQRPNARHETLGWMFDDLMGYLSSLFSPNGWC